MLSMYSPLELSYVSLACGLFVIHASLDVVFYPIILLGLGCSPFLLVPHCISCYLILVVILSLDVLYPLPSSNPPSIIFSACFKEYPLLRIFLPKSLSSWLAPSSPGIHQSLITSSQGHYSESVPWSFHPKTTLVEWNF